MSPKRARWAARNLAGVVDDAPDAAENAPRGRRKHGKPEKKRRSFLKELPILILIAFVLTFLLQQFIVRPYMIPSGSMEKTLHGCPGCTPDKVLVDKLVYRFSDPEPGDVVVFKGPGPWTENEAPPREAANPVAGFFQHAASLIGLAPPDERDFVKRIIAVSGQTVECCDKQNRVLVDGKPLDEKPYLNLEGVKQRPFKKVTVPDGNIWVMGDNRNNSNDSRTQGARGGNGGNVRGAVPLDNIIGKAQFVILPVDRWGGVSDHNPQGASSS